VTKSTWSTKSTFDDNEYGAVSRIIGNGYRISRRKHAPVSLCPPEIPIGLTRARMRAAAVESQQLTSWAMAWVAQWLWLALSELFKRGCVSIPLSEEGNGSSFRNIVFYLLQYLKMDIVQKRNHSAGFILVKCIRSPGIKVNLLPLYVFLGCIWIPNLSLFFGEICTIV
jgi:hypothetical protein